MKNIWRAIRLILEIAIACIIFFFIATKTPLFERALPGRNNETESWSITTGNEYNTIPETIIQTTTGRILKPAQYSGVTTVYESNGDIVYFYDSVNGTVQQTLTTWSSSQTSDPFTINNHSNTTAIEQPVKQGVSCTAPRWEIIGNQETVIAYQNPTANRDNVCLSEIRVCRNGQLWGSYRHESCNYMINGTLILADGSKIDVIEWASDGNQTLVNLEEYIKKRDSIPDRYIQPVIVRDNTTPTLSDVRHHMQNSTIKVTPVYTTDRLDQVTVRDSEAYTYGRSCTTPRWERVKHGSFIYAYNIEQSSLLQQCISQKRSCQDGKLSWSFQYHTCKIIGERIGIITNSSGHTFYPNINSALSYPYHNGQNYITLPSTNSHTTLTPVIQGGSCTTPRWQSISNTSSVIAYRLPTSTDNSLCDKEVRVCRNAVLHGSYTYHTCMEKPNNTSQRNRNRWERLWN